MPLLGFLIAIIAGAVAAGYALWGGSGSLAAFLAYSFFGAVVFVLFSVMTGFFLPARASPVARDLP